MIQPGFLQAARNRSQRRLVKHELPPFGALIKQRLIKNRSKNESNPSRQLLRIPPAAQVVEHRHLRTQLVHRKSQMRTDKPRSAGDQYVLSLECRAVQFSPIICLCHKYSTKTQHEEQVLQKTTKISPV